MTPQPQPRHFSKARRKVAHWLWGIAGRIWVESNDGDRDRWAFWDMSCTFQGTEADAYRIFDAMTDCGHAALGLHESDTRFVVGGMRREEIEEDDRAAA